MAHIEQFNEPYTQEQLNTWKVETFDKLLWVLDETEITLIENEYNDDFKFDFEKLYYKLLRIADEFHGKCITEELKKKGLE
ncbi:hypothetical protein ETI10_10550 [Macrococcoides goetzii]|nr:hypothetical protein [Macrococcus goetzii]TDM39875.1 hypothetical protein ETI10_10550 [Macrococcus goetzii]